MKIQPSKKLYEILEEAFESKYRELIRSLGLEVLADKDWHNQLRNMGVHVQVANSGDGVPYLIEDIMNLVEKGCHELQPEQYMACPDPMNHDSSKFFHVLFFPKELAEKVMILGGLPI